MTYKAGIYAWATEQRPIAEMMTPQPPPIFNVRGMYVGCVPFRALIRSSLECFFDPICLNTTARLISTLPNTDWPKPLNSFQLLSFFPNTTIAKIFEQQMVERWDTEKNFSSYYSVCAPAECTYTLVQRNTLIYVMTMIIGLFGGLSVVIRLISPWIVRFARHIRLQFKQRNQPTSKPQAPQPGTVSVKYSTRILRFLLEIRTKNLSYLLTT